ncbi:MAG TPA: glycosyltransferase [Ktedonobacteraceae bacterium]|jgi:glycosyltransferase involved in cell wall biosynthesis|nr:glycosyltransferase [Ktedonobacteraceae bacterium]
MRSVVIFREELLPISETFIAAQATALQHYAPVYVGLTPARHSLKLDGPKALLTKSPGRLSRWRAKAYRHHPYAPRFHRSIKELRPDLIHAHFSIDGTTALGLQDHLKVPSIVTLHGYDVSIRRDEWERGMHGRRYLARLPKLFHQTSRFLCVSDAIRHHAIRAGFPQEKIVVHYTGVDCSQFTPLEADKRDPALIVFVGRLVEKKGCEYLVRAMSMMAAHPELSTPARLIVIGDGPLRADLEALSRVLNLDAQFLGAQPTEVVRKWIGKARVFCNPSVTAADGDSEGFGMVFAEAQAMGTPVVSSLHGGIPEAVCDGETGLLAPERDVTTLATHLRRFITDDVFWEACSRKATSWVRERFDLHKQTRQLENIYQEVVMEAKQRGACTQR